MNNVMRGSALIFQYAEQHVTGHSNISKIKITEKNIMCVWGVTARLHPQAFTEYFISLNKEGGEMLMTPHGFN